MPPTRKPPSVPITIRTRDELIRDTLAVFEAAKERDSIKNVMATLMQVDGKPLIPIPPTSSLSKSKLSQKIDNRFHFDDMERESHRLVNLVDIPIPAPQTFDQLAFVGMRDQHGNLEYANHRWYQIPSEEAIRNITEDGTLEEEGEFRAVKWWSAGTSPPDVIWPPDRLPPFSVDTVYDSSINNGKGKIEGLERSPGFLRLVMVDILHAFAKMADEERIFIDTWTGIYIDIFGLVAMGLPDGTSFLTTKNNVRVQWSDVVPMVRSSWEGLSIWVPHKPNLFLKSAFPDARDFYPSSPPMIHGLTFNKTAQSWQRFDCTWLYEHYNAIKSSQQLRGYDFLWDGGKHIAGSECSLHSWTRKTSQTYKKPRHFKGKADNRTVTARWVEGRRLYIDLNDYQRGAKMEEL
ncbi:hypothetical protein HDU76_005122 [Blyttiomyces sp. JEL0837]|nr:hypothetical protein HDU76_005122 [Blyttiomyces sp. JEL0837]